MLGAPGAREKIEMQQSVKYIVYSLKSNSLIDLSNSF